MPQFILCILPVFVLFLTTISAQEISPTHRDVAYDDKDSAQVLDVYLAESDEPLPAMLYIHGGGWKVGSKKNVPPWLKQGVVDGRFSVVSVEYRFTDVAPHPAQTNDCLRAVQFVRYHSRKWNIDPDRLGATGGSAGGHLSLYVALHDDVADPVASDPVQRASSRVACAVGFAGPTDWNLLGEIQHDHPAFRELLGYEPGTPFAEMKAESIQDVSPVTFVSEDDPPIMIVHGDIDKAVPLEHAVQLHNRLKDSGVTSELIVVKDAGHGVAGARGPEFVKRAEFFVQQVFTTAP